MHIIHWIGEHGKVKYCVPLDKQKHLQGYFTEPDINKMIKAHKHNMLLFKQDTEEIGAMKNIKYIGKTSEQIIEYFNRKLESDE